MVGWYKDSADARDKSFLKAYLGSDGRDIAWDMIRESMKSISQSAIFLLQVRAAGKGFVFINQERTVQGIHTTINRFSI